MEEGSARVDFETRAIHVGQEPDAATGAVIVPIYQTSTYVQEEVGVHKGFDYSRTANPTRAALEECLASLEGAAHGLAFSSGMGAITTVLHLLSPGDRVVSVNDVYGGTYRIFTKVYEPKGYHFELVSVDDAQRGARGAARRADAHGLGRVADEPAAQRRRHRRGRRRRPLGRRPVRRRQHVRHPVPAAAAGSRRGPRGALDDEVPRRPLRRRREVSSG